MRTSICGAVGLAAIGLLALAPVRASSQKAENGLLGNRLWNQHNEVMRLHGQPTRFELGIVSGAAQQGGGGGAAGAGGGPAGMMGGGMMPGGSSSSPYGGGGGGMGAGMGQRMAQMYGGGGGGGKMGGGPGLPGMGGGGADEGLGGGGPGGMGMMPGGMPGGQGARMGGNAGGAAPAEDGEITWIYEKGPLTNLFLFNKDGRLIQISSFGYTGGAVTLRGVKLGDPMTKVYASYGWTGKVSKDPERNTMVLDYSKDSHVAFQLADRGKGLRVVGITVGITELAQLQTYAPGSNFGGARSASGQMGGMGRPGGGMMSGGGMRAGGGMRGMGGKMGGGGGGGGGASQAID